jgi:PAS domain S-box-containing protein
MERSTGGDDAPALAALIRSHRDSIVDEWERRVRRLSPATKLSPPELRDHLPRLLDRIAHLAEQAQLGELPAGEAEDHALERLRHGFDLVDVVREYALLRDILIDEAAKAGVSGMAALHLLGRVIDHVTLVSVARFSEASERVLKGVDRISKAAIGAHADLPSMLERLLRPMMETSPAVDSAAILLRDGDRLRVRAAIGLIADRDHGFSLAIGEGFAGTIAKERKPRLVRNASADPLVKSDHFRLTGVRALYGVPLLDGDLIGVAHMGSRTAFEFSEEDMMLFSAMASRATAFIIEKRLRDDIDRRAAELEAILESIPDGIYVGDASGVKRVNRRGYEMLGFTAPAALDRPIGELVSRIEIRSAATGAPLRAEDQVYMRALGGETVDSEVVIRRSDNGEDRWLRSIAAPVRLHGAIVGAVTVNSDITERKRLEGRLRNEAEYRERFMAILGHDLRTPVSAISLAAGLLLQQEAIGDRATRMVRRILSSTARIESMIRDLLDFARARSGDGVPLRCTPLDLGSCARQVVDELALAHPEREIEVTIVGDVRGVWDGGRVAQLLSNLVSNALHYSPHDTPVTVAVRGEGARVTLAVTNRGEPIPEALRSHLFEPFRRGDTSDDRREQGLGLGLFIAHAIVTAHGGAIDVTSSAGAGTTFTVRLPRAVPGCNQPRTSS